MSTEKQTGILLGHIYMKDFCNSCVLSYEGKSVETLWLEFKEALNYGIQKFIPSKFVGKKKRLP